MARLYLTQHPDRVFKDDEWRYGKYDGTSGYLSIGDHGEPRKEGAELWAFAVENPYSWPEDENALFDAILGLDHPFIRAEVVMIGGERFAIGFFPEPD